MIASIEKIKTEATARLAEMNWPQQKDEEWRRSDPAQIPFDTLESADGQTDVSKNYVSQISKRTAEIEGVSFYSWDDEASEIAEPLLRQALSESLDKVDLWRLSRLGLGGVIHVVSGAKATEKDAQICHALLEGADASDIHAPCIAIVVDESAHFHFDIRFQGDGFFAHGLYITLAKGAECHVNQLQDTTLDAYVINSTFAKTDDEAQFFNTSGQVGAMMAVDRVHASAQGTHSHVILHGFYLGREDQLLDMRTYQQHVAIDSNSRSLYHGLALDETHTVYRGLIEVGEQATETDAYLTNKNLLLSEDARMDSIPCLNIGTNDVRCSHGATTGTLDTRHIYYLMSRGLSEVQAKELLVEGFFGATFDSAFNDANEVASTRVKDLILGNI